MSSVPVSSPTRIIWTAAPGNRSVRAERLGEALALEHRLARPREPPDEDLVVRASVATRMASGSGTPARDHRAEDPAEALDERVADRSPMTGSLAGAPSRAYLPGFGAQTGS